MPVKFIERFIVSCKCGDSIDVANIKEFEMSGWKASRTTYSTNEKINFDNIKDIMCPECAEKNRQKKLESEDMRERVIAGYYDLNPHRFVADAYEYCGISGNPKASKAFDLAYERGFIDGNLGILNNLVELADLIK